MNKMKAVFNQARTLGLEYCVNFMNKGIKDIAYDTLSFEYHSRRSPAP